MYIKNHIKVNVPLLSVTLSSEFSLQNRTCLVGYKSKHNEQWTVLQMIKVINYQRENKWLCI